MTTFTREQILELASEFVDNDTARYKLLAPIARFQVGDEVRHQDSPRDDVNKCVVNDMQVVGFPETAPGTVEISYELICPGPEGIGIETHWVVGGGDLVAFDYEDPRDLNERHWFGPFAFVDPEDLDYGGPADKPVPVLVKYFDGDEVEGVVVAHVIDSEGEEYMVPAGLLYDPKPKVPGSGS